MANVEINKTSSTTGGKGGDSSGDGFGSDSGGGGDSGDGTDFTYYDVTSTTTMGGGGSNPAATDIPVLTLPNTVNVRDNLCVLLTINISTAITQPDPHSVPVFMEASHDGTNFNQHQRSGDVFNTQILADLTVDTTGVQTFMINTELMNFPVVRFGFNSGEVNLNGLVFTMGVAYVDEWVHPNRHRGWGVLQGE